MRNIILLYIYSYLYSYIMDNAKNKTLILGNEKNLLINYFVKKLLQNTLLTKTVI